MNTIGHLSHNQLISYSKGLLIKPEAEKAGKHLLQCEHCRSSLPVPTPKRFFAALAENHRGEGEEFSLQRSRSFSLPVLFGYLLKLVHRPPVLAWTSSAVILILSLSFLLWFYSNSSYRGEKEIASVATSKRPPELNQIAWDSNTNGKIDLSDYDEQRNDSNRVYSSKKSDKLPIKTAPLSKPKQKGTQKDLGNPNRNISKTRGGVSDCDEEKDLGVEIRPKGTAILFKWKKFPRAKKYHLYISDDDEILIDEFVTDSATSYVLNKSLDETKTYRWKILVILESGETVVGISEKFSVKEFRIAKQGNGRNNESEIRCGAKVKAKV